MVLPTSSRQHNLKCDKSFIIVILTSQENPESWSRLMTKRLKIHLTSNALEFIITFDCEAWAYLIGLENVYIYISRNKWNGINVLSRYCIPTDHLRFMRIWCATPTQFFIGRNSQCESHPQNDKLNLCGELKSCWDFSSPFRRNFAVWNKKSANHIIC